MKCRSAIRARAATQEREVLFLRTRLRQASDLTNRLGCEVFADGPKAGMLRGDRFGATGVEGLYVAGDASDLGVPSVVSAVAEGSVAATIASKAFFTEHARTPSGGKPARGGDTRSRRTWWCS